MTNKTFGNRNGADKTRGVRIHMQAFIARHGQIHRQGEQMANSYIEGKVEEYSSKWAWSTIGEQYPEGKAERNPGNKQKVRNQTARQHKKTRLNTGRLGSS